MEINYTLSSTEIALLIVVVAWELTLKGFALWKAAKKNDLYWFLILLIVNSVGIIPIIYLAFSKPTKK